DAATMVLLQEAGYQAFLIGEAFMKTDDPATALRHLVTDYTEQLVTFKNSHQIV
ncbi:MAG: indole-3-glycerol-phosphate synthase TrpC, partial [Pedobacter sp.]